MDDEVSFELIGFPIWRERDRWPPGNSAKIFLLDAVQAVGRTLFQQAWTGLEGSVLQQSARKTRIHEEVSLLWPDHAPARRLHELKPDETARLTKLKVAEGAEAADNDRARTRVAQVIEWIRLRAIDEAITTYLLPVKGGGFHQAGEAVWNAHPIFDKVFARGEVEDRGRHWVFLDRAELEIELSELQSAAEKARMKASRSERARRSAGSKSSATAQCTTWLVERFKNNDPRSRDQLKDAAMASIPDLSGREFYRTAWPDATQNFLERRRAGAGRQQKE